MSKQGLVPCPRCKGTGEIAVDTLGIGELVRREREARNLTQAQVGVVAGLSRTQITNIEAGRTEPPISTLRRVADAIGVPMKDLIP